MSARSRSPQLPWWLQRRLRWWQYAWTFDHAHKPLCSRFEGDVLRIGRLHLCRGCTALKLGFVTGGLAVLLTTPGPETLAWIVGGLTLAVATLSWPAWHHRWPRLVRDLLRAAAGALPPAILAIGFLMPLAGLAAGLVLAVLYAVHRRRRSLARGRQCDGCPELAEGGVCSGYRLQAEALRAWEERTSRDLMERGFRPESRPG